MKLHFAQWWIFFLFLLHSADAYSQIIFEQDIVQGGITAAGFSTGQGSGSSSFEIYIGPGSTIKKAYLFSYTARHPPTAIFNLNGVNFAFYTTNVLMGVEYYSPPLPYASPIKLYFKEVTTEINPNTINYNVTIPLQPDLPINEGFWTLFLIVVYENQETSNTAYTIAINDQDFTGNEEYTLNNLNSVNSFFPVGFSLYTDRSGDSFTENNEIFFNSNLLGVVGGSDNVNSQWNFGGVKGHFYYQNNQLFGLDDDIANNTMSRTDGLADVAEYLGNNATSCTFQIRHINFPFQSPTSTNINLAYTLAYTTPANPSKPRLPKK